MCSYQYNGVCRSTCCKDKSRTERAATLAVAAGAGTNCAQLPTPPGDDQPIPTTTTADQQAIAAAVGTSFKQLAKANSDARKADRIVGRQALKQVRKLRSSRAARRAALLLPRLPKVARSNADGLVAAQLLTAQHAPALIHNHQSIVNKCRQYGANPIAHGLVKANICQHSTMMTTVDLRDDARRFPNGETFRLGAIWEPETALSATKVNLQIYVEMVGNQKRALREFHRVARYCPNVEEVFVKVIGEDSRAVAREIVKVLQQDVVTGQSGFAFPVKVNFVTSLYKSADISAR